MAPRGRLPRPLAKGRVANGGGVTRHGTYALERASLTRWRAGPACRLASPSPPPLAAELRPRPRPSRDLQIVRELVLCCRSRPCFRRPCWRSKVRSSGASRQPPGSRCGIPPSRPGNSARAHRSSGESGAQGAVAHHPRPRRGGAPSSAVSEPVPPLRPLGRGFPRRARSAGFTEIHTPSSWGVRARGRESLHCRYFGRPAYLAQSPQLYKQILVALSSGFTRSGGLSEPSRTTRPDISPNTYRMDAEVGFGGSSIGDGDRPRSGRRHG